jgi:hypothetical protein
VNAGGCGAAVRVHGRDHQLAIDEADVEPGLSAEVGEVARPVGCRRDHHEMREPEPAEHIGKDGAELSGGLRFDRPRPKLGAETLPFRDVEPGVEMAVLDDLPDGVEGLRRLEGFGRRPARSEKDRQEHGRRQDAAESHQRFT